jgi:hypothetical protein
MRKQYSQLRPTLEAVPRSVNQSELYEQGFEMHMGMTADVAKQLAVCSLEPNVRQ